MALGEILRKARESRKLTASQVAAATHMKVQTVEAIEHEDFSSMPAAIYCKGFIKLYAEYMGLDPAPLTKEYVERFVEPPPPAEPEPAIEKPTAFSHSTDKPEDLPPIAREQEAESSDPDLFSYGAAREEEPPEKLFDHTKAKPPESQAPSSVANGISAGASKISGAVSGLIARIRERSATRAEKSEEPALEQPVMELADPEVDTSPISLPNMQILVISGAVVGIVLLIFIISSIARFVTRDNEDVEQAPNQELVLPVEPAPPYIN